MDRGAWWAAVYGITKESNTTEQLTLSLSAGRGVWKSLLMKPAPGFWDLDANCSHRLPDGLTGGSWWVLRGSLGLVSHFMCYLTIWVWAAACRVFIRSCRVFGCGVSSATVVHRLSCPAACRVWVPQPGIEPVSPALQGRFLTTGLPGNVSLPFLFGVSFRVTPSWTSCQRTWSLVYPGRELRVSRLFQGAPQDKWVHLFS